MQHRSYALLTGRRVPPVHRAALLAACAVLLAQLPAQAQSQTQAESVVLPVATEGSADGTTMLLGDVETVTVDAERAPFGSRNLIGSVTVVGADQIKNESVNEPLDLLRKLPGVFTEQYNQGIISSDVGVRGFNSQGDVAPLKLLIDGIPSNIHEGVADLKPIFPLDIQRIEIVRGTADPRFGLYAVAGSLLVDTRRGGNGHTFRGVAGSFDTFEAQATSAFESERVSQNLFGGFRYSDGYRAHSELQKYALSGKWYYKFDSNLRLGVHGRLFRMDANAPGYLTLPEARDNPRASPIVSRTDGGIQHNRHGSVHLEWEPSEETALTVRGYQQRVHRQRWVRFTEANDQQERVQIERQSGAISQFSWMPGGVGPIEDLRLSAGADLQYQDNFAARHQTDNNRNRVSATRGQDFDVLNYGAFVHAQVTPRTWWGVSLGLRWDRFDGEFTDLLGAGGSIPMLELGNVLQPKVAAFVSPIEGYTLYGNYGRSAQLPVREGLYSTANLTWSKNDGWEAGVRLDPLRWLHARVAYFRQTASDEVRELFNSTTDFENVGETLRHGLDSELFISALSELDVWASYAYQRAERTNPGPNLVALRGTELNHVPRYLLKAGLDVRPFRTTAFASLWVLSQGDYSLTNGDNLTGISPDTRLGGFTIVNLDVSATLSGITFGAHVKNLLDTRWNASLWNDGTVTLTNPGDGRTLLASVETAL